MPEEIDATNSALKLAEENGIDLTGVAGSGEGGRILKHDVEELIESAAADQQLTAPPVDPDPEPTPDPEPDPEPVAEEAPAEEADEDAPKHGENRRVPQDRFAKTAGFSVKKNIIRP